MCLVNLFIAQQKLGRIEIINGWDFSREWDFPNPFTLACSIGHKWTCRERILASLIYDIFAYQDKIDFRDTLMGWAVNYHSCIFTKISPKEIFHEVADMAQPELADKLKNFIARNYEDKSMGAFFLKAVLNENEEYEIAM